MLRALRVSLSCCRETSCNVPTCDVSTGIRKRTQESIFQFYSACRQTWWNGNTVSPISHLWSWSLIKLWSAASVVRNRKVISSLSNLNTLFSGVVLTLLSGPRVVFLMCFRGCQFLSWCICCSRHPKQEHGNHKNTNQFLNGWERSSV